MNYHEIASGIFTILVVGIIAGILAGNVRFKTFDDSLSFAIIVQNTNIRTKTEEILCRQVPYIKVKK